MNVIKTIHNRLENNKLWDKTISLGRNEFLKVCGSVETRLFYIVSGSLKIFILDNTEEHIIRFGYQKNFIVALDSFISEKPSSLYIQAIKQTEIKSISKTKYLEFLNSDPSHKLLWDKVLESLILQQLEREIDILTTSPYDRYQRVLKRSPQLFQEIPNKYIASYLRMTPETLSRIKKS